MSVQGKTHTLFLSRSLFFKSLFREVDLYRERDAIAYPNNRLSCRFSFISTRQEHRYIISCQHHARPPSIIHMDIHNPYRLL